MRTPKEMLFLSAMTCGYAIFFLSYLYATGSAVHWMDKWHGQTAGTLTLLTAGIPAYYVFGRMVFGEPRDVMFMIAFSAFHLMIILPVLIALVSGIAEKKAKRR